MKKIIPLLALAAAALFYFNVANSEKTEFTHATVQNVSIGCRYYLDLPRPSRYLTNYQACVPRSEISAKFGKPLKRVLFSKASLAHVSLSNGAFSNQSRPLILGYHHPDDAHLPSTPTREFYPGVKLAPGDNISVGVVIFKDGKKIQRIFYDKHLS